MPDSTVPAAFEPPDFYMFRSTTAKLCDHLAHIIESGDQPIWPVFIGAREWVIICRKAGTGFAPELRESAEDRRRLSVLVNRLERKLDGLEKTVSDGVRRGIKDRDRGTSRQARAGR